MAELLVAAPLPIEAMAVAGNHDRFAVGRGQERAMLSGARLSGRLTRRPAAVALVGTCAPVTGRAVAGEVIVGQEIQSGRYLTGTPGATVRLPAAPLIATELGRLGLSVRSGTIRCTRAPSCATVTDGLATDGLMTDGESWTVARAVTGDGHPMAVVQAVIDKAAGEGRWAVEAARALRTLARTRPALERWAAACMRREVVLAGPRSFCAGVERAIQTVELALGRYGRPVYVRRQIVHNTHVVEALEAQGAVFVQELEEVPEGAIVVFAAHGVSPAVRTAAAERGLTVVDATCPLVTKVHREARRFVDHGYTVVLVGHRDHEEIEGTRGEAPGVIQVVERPEDIDAIEAPDPGRVAYLTQTTLAVDETAATVEVLRDRFPGLVGPASDDICYATQNRQDAVRLVASECDVLIVIGSTNSSNSNRLVEVAQRAGCEAHLVEDETELQLGWLIGRGRIGISAGASAPEDLVHRVIDALGGLGPLQVTERQAASESTRFSLPPEVR